MSFQENIAPPVLFNAIKHHRAFQINFVSASRHGLLSAARQNDQLLKVGNSMIDLYCGGLSVAQICSEIAGQLKSMTCYERRDYLQFLNTSRKRFKLLELSDGSSWTLLIGREPQRYIHIHPSRASLHTVRVRALALKTALLLLINYEMAGCENNLIGLVNEIRGKYLRESPIKNESYAKGLKRALNLFNHSPEAYMLLRSSASARQ